MKVVDQGQKLCLLSLEDHALPAVDFFPGNVFGTPKGDCLILKRLSMIEPSVQDLAGDPLRKGNADRHSPRIRGIDTRYEVLAQKAE